MGPLRADRIISEVHPELSRYFGTGQAYADHDGRWFEWPESYPAILFDDTGYIVFYCQSDCYEALYLSRGRSGKWWENTELLKTEQLNFLEGISEFIGYHPCDHSHRDEVSGARGFLAP